MPIGESDRVGRMSDGRVTEARAALAAGRAEAALELLQAVRSEYDRQPTPAALQLEVWRGLLAVAHFQADAAAVQEAVQMTMQLGRELCAFDSQELGSILHQAALALASVGAGGDAETFFMQAFRRLPDDARAQFDYLCGVIRFYSLYGYVEYASRWSGRARELAPDAESIQALERMQALLMDAEGKGVQANTLRAQSPTTDAWKLLDQARSQRRLGWASKADPLFTAAMSDLPDSQRPLVARELALTRLSRRDVMGAQNALFEAEAELDPVTFEAQLLVAERARLLQFQGMFAEAEALWLEVIASWDERFGPGHPLTLRLRERLVELCILRRTYLPGIGRCKEMLKDAATRFGAGSLPVARALYWMALVWSASGNRDGMRQALKQAREIWDEQGDLWDVERAQVHYATGMLLADEMEFYRAEEEIRKAIDMTESCCGDKLALLGTFLNGLADIQKITGRDRGAQESAARAQELLRPKS